MPTKGKPAAKAAKRKTLAARPGEGRAVDVKGLKVGQYRTARGTFPVIPIEDLVADPKNVRVHNPRNQGVIQEAIERVGAARSIAIDEDLTVMAGNATVEAAMAAGVRHVLVVPSDGSVLVAVQRSGLTAGQKFDLAVADNRAAELATGWDAQPLQAQLQEFEIPTERYFYAGELPAFQPQGEDEKITDTAGPTGSANRDVEDELRRILDEGEQHIANLRGVAVTAKHEEDATRWLVERGPLVIAELRGRLKTRRGANELDERSA